MTVTGQQIAAWCLAAPPIGIGIWVTCRTFQAREWQPVGGIILSFEKCASTYGGLAKVKYKYQIAGQSHVGERISVWDWWFAQGAYQVHRLSQRFPAGTPVQVYCNPSAPSQSVLVRPGYFCGALHLAVGFTAMVLPIVFPANQKSPEKPLILPPPPIVAP